MKDSPVPDMYSKIEEESTILGKIASKIPGFSGYMERSRRREADQILRQTIANRLEDTRLQLSNAQQDLSRDIIKAIDHAEPLGRADTRLMGLVGKIKDAPQGYAGFFDAVKVKEEDLARIYAFDESMLAYADQIAADIAAVEKAIMDDGDVGSAIHALDSTLREANNAFNSRQEIMSGVA
ncbi:MAG: hypothetical protein L0332_27555 [Chloroflexi bacterium]|nr:hypothetical protein [Chloroflexota bacterium]MCI0578981.1 hypothetical protein [Chloroflexota bacterium]MCI0644632.1 hypothetical protein [Chloroflexota bacterium]MCI0730455.1 hypothetical protein [Chloroflexota bacterium]